MATTNIFTSEQVSDTELIKQILHELQVHQIELEMQNDDLRHSNIALEESRASYAALYADLYHHAPISYLAIARNGLISEVNDTAAELLGAVRSKLLQSRFDRLIAPEDRDRWQHHFVFMAQRADRQSCELAFRRRDGSVFHALLDCLQVGGAPFLRISLTDITERKLLERALVSVAEERQRSLGQELHDNLGQQLAAIAYQASALEKMIQSSGSADAAKFAALIAVQAQSAVMQCKQLAQGLLPFEIEASGLILALQALAARVGINYQIGCEFVCTSPDVWLDDATLALNLYRIAQEAVSNAVRHGKAKTLIIQFASDSEGMRLSIFDDGRGFEEKAECATGGMGIKIMQYRVKELGGTLAFLGRAEGGTEVRVDIRRG